MRTLEEVDRILNFMAGHCYGDNYDKFYVDLETGEPKEINVPEKIALCHSELSEALEGHRKGLMDNHLPHRSMVEVELADLLIRVFDLCGYLKLDIGGAVIEKIAYNRHRKDHTREARLAPGGKKY